MEFFSWLSKSIFEFNFWLQPVLYAGHGYIATEMALAMLFRPYEPVFIPGTKIQLPFTPGIFPRGQHKLSVAIANTITDTLLTAEDIKRQTEKLVSEENIYQALHHLIDSIGDELRDISHIQGIYRFVDQVVPSLLVRFASEGIAALERGDDKAFNALLERVFTYALPKLHLNYDQAGWLVDQIFNTLLPPDFMRTLLVDILTDQNIDEIDKMVRHQVKGLQGLLVQFIDIKKPLNEFRHFLLDQPQEANAFILALIDRAEIREKLTGQVMLFSPHNLAGESLEVIRHALVGMTRNLLLEHKEEIGQMLSTLSEEATHSITNRLLQIDFNDWAEKSLPGVKRDLARFIHTYLNKQLEYLLSKALPAISMNAVIVEKIDRFSAKELEDVIQKICHRELRSLAYLGAFLGFWLGLVTNFFAFMHWIPTAPK